MGIDIHGWVEVRDVPADHRPWHQPVEWVAVITIGGLLGRNYDMFGCLFGVQNPSHFVPVAPRRGFPGDPSAVVRDEIAQLQPFVASGDVHSASWLTWSEIQHIDWSMPAQVVGPIGLSLVDRVAKRRDALEPAWLLFDLMRRLARDYGGDNVRLVVWFDS